MRYVHRPHMVILPNRMPIFEWCMWKACYKEWSPKYLCYDEIRLCAQDIHITLALIMNTFQRVYLCDLRKGLRAIFFTVNSYYNCCTLVNFLKLGMIIFIFNNNLWPLTLISQWVGSYISTYYKVLALGLVQIVEQAQACKFGGPSLKNLDPFMCLNRTWHRTLIELWFHPNL
jgi:hypothetical protein